MIHKRRGMMFVLSSPSGAGKTTLSRRLLEKQHPKVAMSVSVTTRPMRPGEVDGRDYFFIDRKTFDGMVQRNELLEYAEVFDYCYGTPREFVQQHLNNGVDVLFDIDWQGTQQLRTNSRDDLVSVFIPPPTMPELERRLRSRAQDDDTVVKKRMGKARAEIDHWYEYDYVLVNDDLHTTLTRVEDIVTAERMKRRRQLWLEEFIGSL